MWLVTQHNIFGDGNVRAQINLLINRTDAQFLRVLRRSYLNEFTLQFN
jgi:hypothetical protein